MGVLWGFNWPAVKIALGEIAPWTLRTIGMLFGGLLLAGIALLRGRPLAVRREHWLRLTAGGVLTIAAFNILLAFAQLSAVTSRAAIVTYTMPIWAAVFARIVLGETFDRRRLLGLALAVAGLAVLGLPLLRAGHFQIGLLYALGGGISWAAGTVVTKRYPVAAAPLAIASGSPDRGRLRRRRHARLRRDSHGPSRWRRRPGPPCSITCSSPRPWPISCGSRWLPGSRSGSPDLGTLLVPPFGVLGAMIFIGDRQTATDGIGLVLIVGAAASVLLPPRAVAARSSASS